ncbi:MAG: beta-galactosidase [Pseudomonadales bacterium]
MTDAAMPAGAETANSPRLGVCYYPEHWPESRWADDARRMRELGITRVRVGEFAWSRLEPRRGRFHWDWLDRAIDTLAGAGLGVVLGTPTACPPKWLVDECPEILPADAAGRPRRFGSRRHYCFSSDRYRAEARRIVGAMAERYGEHPAVVAWQTDNEFGCHDTVISHGAAAVAAFRGWLERRYRTVDALNQAWGTVFWSQEYGSFAEIDAPAHTVTEANPAHRMDFQRFSSDQVVSFNREQVEILRAASPGRPITHNFMGLFTDFDHFAVGRDLDVASWDSYPLGFLQQWRFDDVDRRLYRRQGHPDFAGFHHDLYRAVGAGRMWIMEQQPGPVNWASHNAAPLPGMVRLWIWEAIAHGAELVSLFRWRRAPFAQEQMHAGLLNVDGELDQGGVEVARVHDELAALTPLPSLERSPVALVFDYAACWVTRIQPQSAGFSALRLTLACYSAWRRLGIDVDVVDAGADLSGYRAVMLPCLPIVPADLVDRLERLEVPVLVGPRTGSKTEHFAVPAQVEPGPLRSWLPVRVARTDGLAPGVTIGLRQQAGSVHTWREQIDSILEPLVCTDDGDGVWYARQGRHYLAACPDEAFLDAVVRRLAEEAGLTPLLLEPGVRVRRRGDLMFAFNYADGPRQLPAPGVAPLLGESPLAPAGVAVWRCP